jgi:hypothetical protein
MAQKHGALWHLFSLEISLNKAPAERIAFSDDNQETDREYDPVECFAFLYMHFQLAQHDVGPKNAREGAAARAQVGVLISTPFERHFLPS